MGRLSRRGFFKGTGAVAAGAVAGMALPAPARARPMSFTTVKDLTHVLSADFPTYFGKPGLEMERMTQFDKEGYNMFKWHLVEHTGTHIDAPIHFSKAAAAADEIATENLVTPLAVVNIAAKAQDNPDYQVTPQDIKAWEARNGQLPPGACVAMFSGWEQRIGGPGFRNADDKGVMHFPGFHVETAELLIERQVAGLAVDGLSLDQGNSTTFDVHYKWLPSGRWGLENVANLGDLPEAGATLVVGSPKIKGASGGPARLFALV